MLVDHAEWMPNIRTSQRQGRSGISGARAVKPSAQPKLVRTQHLPPRKTAGQIGRLAGVLRIVIDEADQPDAKRDRRIPAPVSTSRDGALTAPASSGL